ncbi:MAG: hypothetical protein PHG03_01610 [Bacilli bacterium]|nr:hypothetical protein [Bacilli bacterium]MDD4795241.1 hypothetical protein [Bacilli bacterium]
MNTDLIGAYSKYKNSCLNEYINLISRIISVDHKKILGNKRRSAEIYAGVIDIYLKKYLLINEVRYDLSKIFIESPYIDEYNLTKEINAISEYFMKNNIIFDLVRNEEEIILMASLLQMALALDELATNFSKTGTNYNNIIHKMLNKYHKINYIFLIDEGKKNTKELINLVKKKSILEKDLYETLTDKNSFNKYILINKKTPIYITQYNYYIEELEKYDTKEASKIYFKKNIDDDFTLISVGTAINTLTKEIQSRKKLSTFLIPIKKKFFDKEKNTREYKKLISSNITSKCIKLLIDCNEIDDNLIRKLKTNKLDYYIYCNKGSILNKVEEHAKYIFSKEFMKNNQIIVADNENIIVETTNIFMEDKDFILEKEN